MRLVPRALLASGVPDRGGVVCQAAAPHNRICRSRRFGNYPRKGSSLNYPFWFPETPGRRQSGREFSSFWGSRGLRGGSKPPGWFVFGAGEGGIVIVRRDSIVRWMSVDSGNAVVLARGHGATREADG